MRKSNFSYWELKHWFQNVDFTIIGSGIVGLNCALQLKHNYPNASILIIEKGLLPQGASTKNAGFACFGSVSELIEDLKNSTENEVLEVLKMRIDGLIQLRQLLGDKGIGYQEFGGYELFLSDDDNYKNCLDKIPYLNDLLNSILPTSPFSLKENLYGFHGIEEKLIYNKYEGQIDTGLMMFNLLRKAHSNGIRILNNTKIIAFEEAMNHVVVDLGDFQFKTAKLLFATNGFSSTIIKENVVPARAQVLITEPIPGLKIKGTFHIDQGYYYFRNVGNRVLFGGARNLDFEGETTSEFGISDIIQNRLEELLDTVILPDNNYEVCHRWSGIMGVGPRKYPIVKQISENVYCGIRLSGMGVAIGSTIGKSLANLTL
ncbi:NAD(P)/FAD-dependent oxidoreductase [Aegicerativicinus sediminis]|uniref:NAD(P)/FAD-dependent oxidoreductase n=1 Tax=Aegicerativicinus sediminis TaxID=2893202 RepID=UPI001E365FF3|nr:FAD-dependent oxidoreductase [Aegicerativicinus sediminis]